MRRFSSINHDSGELKFIRDVVTCCMSILAFRLHGGVPIYGHC